MAETIAGGYYIGEDGRPHDAFGRPLSVSQETAVDVMDGLDEVDGLQQDRAPDAPVPPAKAAKPKRGQ